MKLYNLNDIFERRILRIPDYQRGYSWGDSELKDFWDDVLHLDSERVHYTGVITLEPVCKETWLKWEQDEWAIKGVGFHPFYIVDGQQRITTSIILIQAILETIKADEVLNYQSVHDIKKKYILYQAADGQRESFLFGYEKDDPSYEFLKTEILGVHSHSNLDQKTLYTRNLERAKLYFKKQLKVLSDEDVAMVFKKITQNLKFNLYEIDEEIDVFVTFETMNNRGKSLSSLELLKNRLIYLSTLFKDHDGKDVLRKKINDSWKTIYEYLGKNPNNSLDDNQFLRNHWTMYFKYSRRKGDDYINFLLDEKFTSQNILNPRSHSEALSVEEIEEYVTNLQKAIVPWFYIHNPSFPLEKYNDDINKKWLDKLNRLGFKAFRPLILASFVSEKPTSLINEMLGEVERYNFILFNISQRRSNTGDSEFYGYARQLLNGEVTINLIIEKIKEWINKYYDASAFLRNIEEKYKMGMPGFYKWNGLSYFLYEYEQTLKEKAKQSTQKISWELFNQSKKDNVTIEHVFPQTHDDPYWQKRFGHYSNTEKTMLTHSLGNLVPLSRGKNSSLQKDSFELKKNNQNGVGYYNGSCSENEINKEEEWTSEQILQRGIALLVFLERRWKIKLGDEAFKISLLALSFLYEDR